MAFGFGGLGKHAQSAAGQARNLVGGGEEQGKRFGGVQDVVGEGSRQLRELLRDGIEARFGFAWKRRRER